MAVAQPLGKEVLQELLKIDARSRELLCNLETSVVPLEIKCGDTSLGEIEDIQGMIDSVDKVCDKVISTLKSVKAEHRKYCDLQPERRQHGPGHSDRQDSGIGSGCFDGVSDQNNKLRNTGTWQPDSLVGSPIQEQGGQEMQTHSGDEHGDDEDSTDGETRVSHL